MTKITPAGKSRLTRCKNRGLCPHCLEPHDGTRIVRGEHERCYKKHVAQVEAGETTWEKLESIGHTAPPAKPGRKRKAAA